MAPTALMIVFYGFVLFWACYCALLFIGWRASRKGRQP
jgi:hypothetical protein